MSPKDFPEFDYDAWDKTIGLPPSIQQKKQRELNTKWALEWAAYNSATGMPSQVEIKERPFFFHDSLDPFIFYQKVSSPKSKTPIGPIQMAVKINPNMTQDDLKELWPKIKAWKSHLKKVQSVEVLLGRVQGIEGLPLRLLRQHKRGKGYGTIAKDLNVELESLYRCAMKWERNRKDYHKTFLSIDISDKAMALLDLGKKVNRIKMKYGTEEDRQAQQDWVREIFHENQQGADLDIVGLLIEKDKKVVLVAAERLLKFFGFRPHEIKSFAQDALSCLRQGRGIPWASGRHAYTSPITRQKIIDRLKPPTVQKKRKQ